MEYPEIHFNVQEINVLLVGVESVRNTKVMQKLLSKPTDVDHPSGTFRQEVLQKSGRALYIRQINIFDNNNYTKINMWDPVECKTAAEIDLVYYDNADAVIVLFDCKDQSSLLAVGSWHRYVKNCAEREPVTFILGTNYDQSEDTVWAGTVRKLSRTLGVFKVFLLEAGSDPHIEDIFRIIIKDVNTWKLLNKAQR